MKAPCLERIPEGIKENFERGRGFGAQVGGAGMQKSASENVLKRGRLLS